MGVARPFPVEGFDLSFFHLIPIDIGQEARQADPDRLHHSVRRPLRKNLHRPAGRSADEGVVRVCGGGIEEVSRRLRRDIATISGSGAGTSLNPLFVPALNLKRKVSHPSANSIISVRKVLPGCGWFPKKRVTAPVRSFASASTRS